MGSIGVAWVQLAPSLKGFQSKVATGIAGPMAAAGAVGGRKAGDAAQKSFGTKVKGFATSTGGMLGVGLGAAAAVGFAKSAVDLEKQFSKTMNIVGATLDVPREKVAGVQSQLSDLAMQMGKDTVFSANEAGRAILELARGGLTAATIQGGALEGTLTLAAAGELDMASAANIAVQAMGAFNLEGKDMGSIAAALAGAANASSADVADLAQGLSQASASANAAGLTVQETTAALAAFSNAGVNGSDAGTSLKTMLQRLIPQTNEATQVFEDLGLYTLNATKAQQAFTSLGLGPVPKTLRETQAALHDYLVEQEGYQAGAAATHREVKKMTKEFGIGQNAFVDAQGNFKGLSNMAGQLEKALAGMSDEQRTSALATMFGSDATRAALILSDEGAAGIQKLTKATSDQDAANRQAAATMKGTAGALENLSGAWETLQLSIGQALKPLVAFGAGVMARAINGVTSFIQGVSKGEGPFSTFGDRLDRIGALVKNQLLPAFNAALPVIKPVFMFIVDTIGSAVMGAIDGAIQAITGFLQIVGGIFSLFKALVTGQWGDAWKALKQIVVGAFNTIVGVIKVWLNVGILQIFRKGALALLGSWRGMWTNIQNLAKSAGKGLQNIINGALTFVRNLVTNFVKAILGFWRNLFAGMWNIASNGWKVLRSAFGGATAAIRTVISQAAGAVTGFWRNMFGTMRSTATSAWQAITGGVRTALGAVRQSFENVVRRIGEVWGSLREKTKAPVKFIVDTVYNDGIRRVVNAIPGGPDLDPIKFARGGVMPGYTPGRDVHHFVDTRTGRRLSLSGGEAIMRPEFTAAIGGEAGVAKLNQAAMHGKLGNHLRFFLGGVVPLDYMTSVSQHSGYPWAAWAGDLNGSRDTANPPAAVRAWKGGSVARVNRWGNSYGNHVVLNHGGQNALYAHLSSISAVPGALVGAGQMIGRVGSTGNSSGPHLHFEVRGGTVSGGTGGGGGGGILDAFGNAISAVKDFAGKVKGWMSKLGSMGEWGDIMKGAAKGALGDLRKWINDKIPGPGPFPSLGIFDRGGLLPPGLSLAYNGTGANEHKAVFTTEQWRSMQRVADGRSDRPWVQMGDVYTLDADEFMRKQQDLQRRAYVHMTLGG